MGKRMRVWGWLLLGLITLSPALAGTLQVRYHGPESTEDHRYDYHWNLLRTALERTRATDGDYVLLPSAPMNESRQFLEMTKPDGLIDVFIMDDQPVYRRSLLPVRIPLDKGLLGYRIMLIRDGEQRRFDRLGSLDALRQFSIGQGADWSDVTILSQGGFKVVKGTTYAGLFNMLRAGRFDAFSRGVTEIEDEQIRYGRGNPKLVIEQKLLLHYPLPIYFWFRPDDAGRKLVARVESGLQAMLRDGSFDAQFEQQFKPVITRLGLEQRTVYSIPNPLLDKDTPFNDARLWFDPTKRKAANNRP